MSNGSSGSMANMNACGCCQAEPQFNTINNRPGLSALAYRVATYGLFFQRLLDQIHSYAIPDGPNQGSHPLATLTTRSPDDPAIALLDAWAVIADVLTFYQERIANEGYLRTATERRSILELAREIGYELSPGVAASAYLQFTVEEIIGTAPPPSVNIPGIRTQLPAGPGSAAFNSGIVNVPQGTQVQSVPAPGQSPQIFETSASLKASVEWNTLTPRQSRQQDLALVNGQLYLLGTSSSFPSGVAQNLSLSDIYLLNPATSLDFMSPSFRPVHFQSGLLFEEAAFGRSAVLQKIQVNTARPFINLGSRFGAPTATPEKMVVGKQVIGTGRRILGTANPATGNSGGGTTVPAVPTNQVYLQGTSTNIKTGDRLLLVGVQNGTTQGQVFIVRNVETDSIANTTLVEFADNPALPSFAPGSFPSTDLKLQNIPFNQDNVTTYILSKSISEGDLQAFMQMNGWDAEDLETLVNNPPPAPGAEEGVYSFGAKAAFYGNNAPLWKSLTKPSIALRADPYPLDWDAANQGTGRTIWTDSQGNPLPDADVYLDRAYPQILSSGWTIFEAPSLSTDAIYQITQVLERSVADYSLSGRSTGLRLQLTPTSTGMGLGSPSAVSWAANRLDSFVLSFDGSLYHRWWDGSHWGGPQNLGGSNLINSPSAVCWAANRLDVFAIGSDGNLYHSFWDGSNWGGPENLGGGNLINSPSAVCWAANRIDIFAVGSDGDLYHKWWDGSNWDSGLENLGGGNLVNSPSAVSWAANRLDIFAVGSDGNLYHKWWDGSNWDSGLENLGGGNLINSPSVVSWAANRLDVFALGWDGNLYHSWWGGGGWGGPENLGGNGNLMNSPSVVSWAANRLDIFIIGASGHWFHTWWNGSWGGPEDLGNGTIAPFPVRTTTAWMQSQQLALATIPVVDEISAGTTQLMLDDMVLGLTPGQPVAFNGTQSDPPGVVANEILFLQSITHVAGFTVLGFTTGLQNSYIRSSVTINANVVLATNGATVQEVLGSGNGSQTNQSFRLKRPPLTYVSAPTPSGIASTLQIRVNGLEWQESPTLYGLTASDQEYIVRLADDGTPTVTFGDPAARLKTGQQNVNATYRTGIGLAGNVDAGSLSLLQSRPPGLRGVTNPLAASGAADPQNLADARTNAPLTVLTLDRIVSLDDYQSFTQAFAGIGKAQAVAVWSGTTRVIQITVAAANGDTIVATDPLYLTLLNAIQLANDPVQNFVVAGFQPLTFNLTAGILIDQPTYDPIVVQAAVLTALTAAFSFANRAFTQAVSAAEILQLIQSVPGVIAVYLTQLYLTGDSTGPSQTEPLPFLPALPAYWDSVNGVIQAAQLLLLNPLGVTLTERTS